ncbi:hypothetical protein EO92_17795 [Methanosarcina sp. 2.H.A.1B.4]|nr:hypothetical protein EO92_17795 [Methanosarcina sp. 2.H.A.1B.4]KKH49595.1 hypothetical protein EO93_15725 [Methanosarcina sp. 1.H.A.2.2]
MTPHKTVLMFFWLSSFIFLDQVNLPISSSLSRGFSENLLGCFFRSVFYNLLLRRVENRKVGDWPEFLFRNFLFYLVKLPFLNSFSFFK